MRFAPLGSGRSRFGQFCFGKFRARSGAPAILALLLALAALLGAGCADIKPAPKADDPARTAVQALLDTQREAMNLRDVDRFLSLYDYDAEAELERGTPLSGDGLVRAIPRIVDRWNAEALHCTRSEVTDVRATETGIEARAMTYCYASDRDRTLEKAYRFVPTADGLKIAYESFKAY
ncbi:MAG: hypothetical protein H0S85_07645 [Desulfovibrionaceae bacterium]|jgi:hypothetical protein|nr:hypothetical protein [Desulfovibrionaceae bacterium]